MATGLIAAAANGLLDSLGAAHRWIQLHKGDPGPAGTAQVATETDRMQVTWAAASGGTLTSGGTQPLEWTNVAGSEDYTHFSAWSTQTTGTCGFTGTVTANPVTAGDTFRIAVGGLTATFPVAS